MEKRIVNPFCLQATSILKWYVILGAVLRVVLLFSPTTASTFAVWDVIRSLLVGVLSDLSVGALLLIPLGVLYVGFTDVKYKPRYAYTLMAVLLLSLLYVLCFNTILNEYGASLPQIVSGLLGWKLVSFSLRYFLPGIRNKWRRTTIYLTWTIYMLILVLNCISEYFFWDEFGVRYNFIAVDYLIYTNEVIGNIMESYSIVPLFIVAVLFAFALIYVDNRNKTVQLSNLFDSPKRVLLSVGAFVAVCAVSLGVCTFTHNLSGNNQYAIQLEQNGAYDFVRAFKSSKLDYDQFYEMMPEEDCRMAFSNETGLGADGSKPLYAEVDSSLYVDGADVASHPYNIVLVTVESLSASFFTRYGNEKNLTPNLDALIEKSLVFDSLFATGNRTVRGLEALSLCIPPCSGESVVKRKENNMGELSVGSVLRSLGYTTQYLYGGYSYFDNMGDFFGNNGYEVIDRSQIDQSKVAFANIWGVSDEDIFNKSLEVFDENAKSDKPFFAHIMTTSNHRPYTYPEGRIQPEGNGKNRSSAVRYTDYAIGSFIEQASQKSWFDNTVFIIVADHCASSAGKTSLPVENYHIPCIVYCPSLIKPRVVSTLCSQIDVLPSVFSLLGIKSQVRFVGESVFNPSFHPRTFMATYQDLGYMEGEYLTVLSPVNQVKQFRLVPSERGKLEEILLDESDRDASLISKAKALYQYSNLYLK